VLSNLGLVGSAASSCRRRTGADYDDLFSEGCIALVRAAEGYDPDTHHVRFAAYACPAVKNALRDYVMEDRRIHVPLYLQQPSMLKMARARVADRPRERANLEQRVECGRAAILPFASLSTATPDDRPHDIADRQPSPLETLIQHETAERITVALGELKPLRAYVIAHRMGLCGVAVRTIYALACEMGLSKQRVFQIEHSARADLARVLAPAERACA
jgi:RNA polymerase sigma factor (sigma-70 family)